MPQIPFTEVLVDQSMVIDTAQLSGRDGVPSMATLLKNFFMMECVCLFDTVRFLHPDRSPNHKENVAFDYILSESNFFSQMLKEGAFQPLYKDLLDKRLATAIAGMPPEQKRGIQPIVEAVGDFSAREAARQRGPIEYRGWSQEANKRWGALYTTLVSGVGGISYAPDPTRLDLVVSESVDLPPRNNLRRAYDALARAVRAELRAADIDHRGGDIFIPPIARFVLERASNPSELAEAVLEERKRMAPVRAAFREYEGTIRDKRTTPRQKADARRHIEAVCGEMARTDQPDLLTLADLGELGMALVAAATKQSSEDAIIALIVAMLKSPKVAQIIKYRRVLHLFRLQRQFWNSDQGSSLVSKVYGGVPDARRTQETWNRIEETQNSFDGAVKRPHSAP